MLEIAPLKEFVFLEVAYGQFFLFFTFFCVAIVLFFFSFKKRKRKLTPKQIAKKNLLSLDLKAHPKEVAYSFTKNGYILVQKENEERFLEIVSKLEKYKYQKEVSNLEETLKNEIARYIKETV